MARTVKQTIARLSAAARNPKAVRMVGPIFQALIHNGGSHLAGFCYMFAEALYHAHPEIKWQVRGLKHEGTTHWFLLRDGRPVDPTAVQFKEKPDYTKARRWAFLTSRPSARTQAFARLAGITLHVQLVHRTIRKRRAHAPGVSSR